MAGYSLDCKDVGWSDRWPQRRTPRAKCHYLSLLNKAMIYINSHGLTYVGFFDDKQIDVLFP